MAKLAAARQKFQKLKLIDPAGNDIGVTLHVVGNKDSKEYNDLILKQSEQSTGKGEDGEETKITPREATKLGCELVCALVVGVDEADAFDSPDFKKELLDLLMTGEYGWVAEQVLTLAKKRELFYKGSPSN